MKLRKNLSLTDRIVRLTVGVACMYIGFVDASLIENMVASSLIGVFGLINLFAFFTSFCPVYAVAGLSTIRKPSEQNN